ncbi:MAG: GNAT family N-acetyltransferase [Bacteroidota bacterium]
MAQVLTFKSLTTETWKDFEKLLGPRGACGGCWCMTWRLPKATYEKQKGDGNKRAIHNLVKQREQVGILAFDGDEPVGWCAVAPREKYVRLAKSRVLKPVDEQKVWSVSCFFISKSHRRKGVSIKLLNALLDHARKKKVKILEAYPVEPKDNSMPDVFAWTGFMNSFIKAGFREVKRHSPSRPIVRYYL